MDIAIFGEGEVVIRFIDPKGRTLVQEKISISGSPTIQGRRSIELSVKTTNGPVQLAPILVRQSNPKQRVTFDHEQASDFARRRCMEIGCSNQIVTDAELGIAPEPAQPAVLGGDDNLLARAIREVTDSRAERQK